MILGAGLSQLSAIQRAVDMGFYDIDGIATFASDVAIPTVGFVAEQLELIGAPFRVAQILSNKANFRAFQKNTI